MLKVAIISEGANTWPLYVAQARGFFDRLVAFIRALLGEYDWLTDRSNKTEAVRILAGRLKSDPAKTEQAYETYVLQPAPEIRPEGLRQVMDVVWETEEFRQPKAAPEKYLDLDYYAAARRGA